MKKKMMAVLLALTLTAGTMSPLGVSAEEQPEVSTEHVEIQELGAGVYTGTCGEGAEYTLDENGTLTITGNGSIDFGAFRGFGKEDDKRVIKKVVISSGMIGIGNFAFENCSDLKSVEIPASVTSIGSAAFKDCSGLESMNIDEANTTYENPEGSNAIVEKSSKTLVARCKNTKIPDDVKIIGAYAFCGCSDLKSIEIPDNVSEIQVAAFDDCSNLTAIHIPAGVDKIALGVFMGCSNLNSITIDSANRSYESPGNANAIIDKGTMTLLEGSNNTVIPEGVKRIWQNAFAERIHLKSITIPASVTSIVGMPFSDCDSLEEIKVDADNAIFDSRNNCNAIIESATNTLIAGCGKTVIPEGIETIGDSAFERVKTLTHVTIPKSVTEIRGYAFERCENLSTVNLQKGIQTIGYGAFTECVGLTNLIFCGTKADWQAVTIDEDGREELESVLKYHELVKKEKVPATCGKDGSEEYWTCSICDQVYLSADMTQNPQELTAPIAILATGNHSWDNGVVTEKATTAKEGIKTYTCTVCKATKTEKIAKLKPTNNNSSTVKKGTKVTIKGYKYTVKNSSEVTFTGVKNKKASKISIPTTVKIKNKKYKVTAMSEKSLKGVQAKTIIVGNNVQTIGNSAMENCKQLIKVTLGKNVKKIGKNVFKSDKKLKNITIKSTKLKSVGKNAFKGINSKPKITVPKKKYTSYKKLMKGKGQGKKVKIVKAK